MRMLAFRALFAAGCFSAFAIFGWGVETATVVELILLLILVVIAMIVPAAAFVALIKLISCGLNKIRNERSPDEKICKGSREDTWSNI